MASTLLPFRELPTPLQVVLLAARTTHTQQESEQLKALCTADLNWTQVAVLALHHSLASLVHIGLNRCCWQAVPTEIQTLLQQRSMANAFRAFRWMREASRLASALGQAGTPVLILKGVPLSQQLYGSPHARHVGDIDLLGTPARLDTLIETFDSLGYDRINPSVAFTPRRLRTYARFWKDLTFRHRTDAFDLDLHWRLFNHRMHPANRLLPAGAPQAVSALGCTVPVLPLQEQFLHVASHGVSDAWIYLKSLADVAGFLALLSPAQLEQALRKAQQIGLLPQISAAIHLSNAWMGSGITSPLLLPIDHPLARELHASVSSLLLSHAFRPTRDDRTPAAWVGLERAQMPGIPALVENLRRFLWRPRVWSRFNLPDTLFWLYPILGLILPPRADSLYRRRPAHPKPAPGNS